MGATRAGEGFEPAEIYRKGYFDGASVDGYADYRGSESVLRAEFRRTVKHLRKGGATGGRLLEVGCAYGFFLAEAAAHFQCTGIEVCHDAVAHCRGQGLDVRQGLATPELLQELGTFDAIVMLDVIEHLDDPAEVVGALAQAVRPGGHLLLTTGDWDSWLSRLLGRRWRLMTPPQHLYFFSRPTLTRLLERTGFRVVECVRPWKVVPVGLAAYQLGARLGFRLRALESLTWLGLPVNLFDTVRVIAQRSER